MNQTFRMYLLALGIILTVALLFVVADKVLAQQPNDPLLTDARYFRQVKNTLLQEQRANALQIQILDKRQQELEAAIKGLDIRIKELEAPPAPAAPVEPPEGEPVAE